MRGKVEPGALCLVTYGLWAGAAVRVVGEPPWSFLLMMRHLCPSLYPWWQVEVTDGIPRETINTIGELLGPKTHCFMLEKHLMPLDPDADVKAEPREFDEPIRVTYGTYKIPTTTRSALK